MKPSFALDFRDGVIALLHRTSRGWQQVGVTALDSPDLAEALGYLRATALGLSPRGLSTKLVIPEAQILYTQVHAPGPEAAKRRRQIKAALEGLTPYKAEDLVFDWWGSGPQVHVAVVARETLAEAEAFATEHRFNPVSFVAAPNDGDYRGEPFFGPSALAASLLAEGEKVERDQEPIVVMGRDYPRRETDAAEPVFAAPAPVLEPEVQAVDVAVPEVVVEPVVVPEPVPEPVPEAVPEAVPEPVPEPEPVIAVAAPVAAQAAEPAPQDPDALPDFSTARAPAAGVSSFDPQELAVELVDEAPMALDVTDEPQEPPVVGGAAGDDLPPGPASAMAFASRRSADAPEPVARSSAMADFAAAQEAKARKTPAVGPAPTDRPSGSGSVPRPALARPAAALPSAGREALPFPGRSQGARLAPAKAKDGVTAPGIAGLKRDRNVVPLAKPAAAQAAPTGAAKPGTKGLTGLDGRPLPVRGKPRYMGLILTGLLLLALAVVAAWSSFYLSSNEADPNAAPAANAVASASDPAADGISDPATEALPSVADEALADGQDPDLATASAVTGAEAFAELAPTEPTPVGPTPEGPTPVGLTPAEPVTMVAAEPAPAPEPAPEPAPGTSVVTDAAVAAPPDNDPQDEIFLAAADTPPQTFDPLVMPQLTVGNDPPPDLAAPPPPFGTVYTFDAEGRIQPTPEGIMTPEGVLLIAGAPKVVPPLRPAALAATPVVAPVVGPVVGPEVLPVLPPVETAVPDPALAGKKPKPRPASLLDPAATAEQQGEVLAPAPDSRFAAARPQRRPDALTQTASAAPVTEAANQAAAASLALGGVKASTATLAVSKKPAARPSGMDQAVDAAVAAAVAAAVRAPEPEPLVQTASLAPEEQSEPEAEAPAPRLPTSASVAKQATTKDALNLSRLALLGIFGTASGRYALVRQPGGGVKKIVVGDTIDGGRVAAITASAVQYQKGGRMLTLALPKG